MEILNSLAMGFGVALSPGPLLMCLIGVTVGTFIGVLPGIGPIAGVSLLLPLTFRLEPTEALIMLAGIYYGAQYGGAIASILLNLPGTASHAVTCLDGYPMSKKGRGGAALFLTTCSSFTGGIIAILLMVAFSPMLARVAIGFGSPEYASMMVLGLLAAATLSSTGVLKALAMVVVGLMIGLVGADPNTGLQRFGFGQLELYDGINIVVLAMGLFGVAEVLSSLMNDEPPLPPRKDISLKSMLPTRLESRQAVMPTIRGSAVGSVLGILPGAGAIMASFLSYALEKRVSKTPEIFGTGAVAGVTSVEAAANAAAQAAFIPTMTLGIPGSAVMSLMLGALMIHGIAPGPMVIVSQPGLFWGLIASFFIGNIMLVILNLPLIGIWLRILLIPRRVLFPGILFFICVGTYGLNNSTFDVMMVLGFGIFGYLLREFGYPPAPLILGFILGPLLEEHVRRALMLSGGDPTVFVTQPISGAVLLVCAALLAFAAFSGAKALRRSRLAEDQQ